MASGTLLVVGDIFEPIDGVAVNSLSTIVRWDVALVGVPA